MQLPFDTYGFSAKLEKNTTYNFAVKAETSIGWGPERIVQVLTLHNRRKFEDIGWGRIFVTQKVVGAVKNPVIWHKLNFDSPPIIFLSLKFSFFKKS